MKTPQLQPWIAWTELWVLWTGVWIHAWTIGWTEVWTEQWTEVVWVVLAVAWSTTTDQHPCLPVLPGLCTAEADLPAEECHPTGAAQATTPLTGKDLVIVNSCPLENPVKDHSIETMLREGLAECLTAVQEAWEA